MTKPGHFTRGTGNECNDDFSPNYSWRVTRKLASDVGAEGISRGVSGYEECMRGDHGQQLNSACKHSDSSRLLNWL